MSRPGSPMALLGSLCLFLSALEYLIPRPLPFMRIGLANLPLLLALDLFGPGDYFLLALLKVAAQGIISGSLFSYVFLFSLAGTFSSAALMYGLRHLTGAQRSGFAGIGCAGALLSNGVQLLLARYFVFGTGIRFLIPPFLASGLVSGTALGLFCEAFCRRSRWYAAHARHGGGQPVPGSGGGESAASGAEATAPLRATEASRSAARRHTREERRVRRFRRWDALFRSDELCIAGFVMVLAFLCNDSLWLRIPQFVFFCCIAWLSGKKRNPLVSVLCMAGIVFFNLLAPYGKVLCEWGPLRITQGSLLSGAGKAVTLEGLVLLSGACIRPGLRLPGAFGVLLAESFRILELIPERRILFRRGRVIEGLDRLMTELDAAPPGGAASGTPAPQGQAPRNAKGLLLLAGMTALMAALGVAGALMQ